MLAGRVRVGDCKGCREPLERPDSDVGGFSSDPASSLPNKALARSLFRRVFGEGGIGSVVSRVDATLSTLTVGVGADLKVGDAGC